MKGFIVFNFLFLSFLNAANPAAKCLKAGESDYRGGVPSKGDFEKLAPCCSGLVEAQGVDVSPLVNGECSPMGGAYGYACIPCGNGKCETKFENKCNCPKDCK